MGQPPTAVTAETPQWALPLPTDRHMPAFDSPSDITYGDYFTAVCDYLSPQRVHHLLGAVARVLERRLASERLAGIRIHLIKHGAFYHPALLTFDVGGDLVSLVVNVAVSNTGRCRLPSETACLQALERDFAEDWIPRVFDSGIGCVPGQPPLPMFAAEWFADFHELHRISSPDDHQAWAVWDAVRGPWHLDETQVAAFFRQSMAILTCYFDPHTLCAIIDWHHAAGDFVVQENAGALAVRLITVRRYAPLFQLHADDSVGLETLLDALAVFFMRSSLWMRLDRVDGVGALVWAGDHTVAPMWQGFIQGLESIARRNDFPVSFVEGVRHYFARHQCNDWQEIGEAIVGRCAADLPEAALMSAHLGAHVAVLRQSIHSSVL